MNNMHLLGVLAAIMMSIMLTSMYFLNRKTLFKRIFWISLGIYIAIVGIIVLRLLGENDPVIIIFLLAIALTTSLLTLRVFSKN